MVKLEQNKRETIHQMWLPTSCWNMIANVNALIKLHHEESSPGLQLPPRSNFRKPAFRQLNRFFYLSSPAFLSAENWQKSKRSMTARLRLWNCEESSFTKRCRVSPRSKNGHKCTKYEQKWDFCGVKIKALSRIKNSLQCTDKFDFVNIAFKISLGKLHGSNIGKTVMTVFILSPFFLSSDVQQMSILSKSCLQSSILKLVCHLKYLDVDKMYWE